MISLIKIRLIHIGKNPIKYFFNYCILGIILFFISIKLKPLKINKKIEETLFKCDFSYNEEIITKNQRPSIYNKLYALISNNKTIAEYFKSYSKIPNAKIYDDEEKMKYEIQYTNLSEKYNFALNIEYNNNNYYKFKIRSDLFTIDKSLVDVNSPLDITIDTLYGSNTVIDIKIINIINFLLYRSDIYLNSKTLKIHNCFLITPNYNKFAEKKLKFYKSILPFLICFIYLFFFISFFLEIIDEKEKKIELFLKKKGFNVFHLYSSRLIFYLIVTSFSFYFIYHILKHLFLVDTPKIDLILSQFYFNLCIFGMIFFVYQFTCSILMGQIISFILLILIVFSGLYINSHDTCSKYFFIFFPFNNEIELIQIFFMKENYYKQIKDLNDIRYHNLTLNESFKYFKISIIFYFILGILIDYIKNYFFIFLYFLRHQKKNYTNNITQDISFNNQNLTENENNNKKNILKIQKITKKYENEIIKDLDCNLYSGEIFCLIGRNGSGKSTLLKLISGIEIVDNGDILYNNQSLYNYQSLKSFLFIKSFLNNIGFYSQDDILFDDLSVESYLSYLCDIKGNIVNKKDINNMLDLLDLTDKKYYFCNTLSYGQKKSLLIGLTLLGNENIILLDEPTKGIDNSIKKKIWDYIKFLKKDKIILITTNDMEEAEYLSDKIGILNDGKIFYSGTSSDLKEQFSCGFNLNLILNSKKFKNENKQNIINEFLKYYENLKVKISSRNYISITFNALNDNTNKIFEYIESVKEQFGIIDYNISTTSLEDVFLKVNKNNDIINENDLIDLNNLNIKRNESNTQLKQCGINLLTYLLNIIKCYDTFFIQLLSFIFLPLIFLLFNTPTPDKLQYFDLKRTLTSNPIYVNNEITKKYLENSSLIIENNLKLKYNYFNSKPNFSEKKEKNIIISFANNFINESKLNNEKLVIYMNNSQDDIVDFYFLYQIRKYYIRDIANSWIYSAFLKNEYNINASIFDEYGAMPHFIVLLPKKNVTSFKFLQSDEEKKKKEEEEKKKKYDYTLIFGFIGFLLLYGGYSFNTLVKDKENYICNYIKFTGGNIIYYWLYILIFDIIKYIIFYLLFVFYIKKNFIAYEKFLVLLRIYIIAVIPYTYFLASITNKMEQNIKTYYIIFFSIFLIGTSIIVSDVYNYFLENQYDKFIKYFFVKKFSTIFNYIPITSLIFANIRIIASDKFVELGKDLEKYKTPPYTEFFDSHYNNLIILVIIYSILFLILESNILNIIYSLIINKIFINHQNYQTNNDNSLLNNNDINKKKNYNLISSINEDDINNEETSEKEKLESLIVDNSNNIKNIYEEEQINKMKDNLFLSAKIFNLSKTYFFCCNKNINIINNLYFGLEKNENLGILGNNGSGKTTLFNIIIKEIQYDNGEIELFNSSNSCSLKKIIGYCPHENILIDYFTVKYLLMYFISIKNSNYSIDQLSKTLSLEKYMNYYCKNLSDGNKKKLTFLISILNYPKILLLDDCTNGIDPQSKIEILNNIIEISNNNNNVILSTNSLIESEIICDNISLLKNGTFDYFGDYENLKKSFLFKLYIKFKKIIQFEEKEHKNLNDLNIEGINISSIMDNNTEIRFYYDYLYDVIQTISDKCYKISMNETRKDYSFVLILDIKKNQQGELFNQLLNIKKDNDWINEIYIRRDF